MSRNEVKEMLEPGSLLAREIDWLATPNDPYLFYAEIDGERYELRLNDFPQEPYCTIEVQGLACDLNSWGRQWRLPKHRGE
jgi:hypothetical protein